MLLTQTFPKSAARRTGAAQSLDHRALLGLCAIAFLVFCWLPKNMADPDVWWHLRNAGAQLAGRAWLTHDLYSFTARGSLWINHEWLAELPFYLGWRAWGPQGVLLVTAAITECVLLLLFLLCYRRSRSLVASVAVAFVGSMLATVSFGPRTLLFGWLCLIVELHLLDRWWHNELSDRAAQVAFPVLFCCWINLHGSWLIGMVLLSGFFLCARLSEIPSLVETFDEPLRSSRVLWKAWALSLAAVFANPYGWQLVLYPFDLAFKQKLNVANVIEWRPLDFQSGRGKAFLFMLAALFLLQIFRASRWALYELFYLALGVYAACSYSRFLFLAALLVCPLVAARLAKTQADAGAEAHEPKQLGSITGRPIFHVLLIVALLAGAVARFPTAAAMQAEEGTYPVKALPFLATFQPKGNVFNEYLWGGFLEWHARQVPVFIDSRVDIFERNGTFADYLDIVHLKDSVALLAKHNIRYVLFEKDTPLVKLLQETQQWRTVYVDSETIVLEKEASR